MDVLRLEVLWNRLLSVVNEQQVTLMRTAFSTVVRESQDLACGVFDRNANMMAQSLTGTPAHINTMATGMRHFMDAHPPDTLEPGDVLITNDPWQTAGQINDMTVVTPVFHRGRVVAFFASCCHSPDVGGRVYGGGANEIYEEGIRIPIMHLMRRGEPNETLVRMIRANVRVPDETIGDLWAQMACNDVGGRDLVHFLEEFDLPDCEELSAEIIRRSEGALREAIRALPDGTYTHEAWSDGFNDIPVKIAVAVTIAGDEVHIDYTGSSEQSPSGINVVLNYTQAYSSFAIKSALNPEVPHNEGAFRPVTTTAPPGSILNCREPAAVAARHLIGHMLPCTIFGALAKAMPGRLMAGGAESSWLTVWRGTWPGREDLFTFTLFQSGGAGARATKDGLQTNGFPSGVAGVPAEVYETRTPLVMHRKELRQDSGGAGRWRGGLGQETESSYRGDGYWGVSTIIDRLKFAGQPIAGGKPGAIGEYVLATGEHPPAKTLVPLKLDDHVYLRLAGGAGYGDPRERPAELVLRDVVLGFVSVESAERDYGVVIRYGGGPDRLVRLPEHYAIDEEATARLRATT
jgi:N-methylhydantoinase B